MQNRPVITPGRSGSARVEYFACREDIEAMLAQGYSNKMVYDSMMEQGRITCSYSAFCDYVRGGGKRKHSKGKKSAVKKPPVCQAQTEKPRTGPRIIKAEEKHLQDPRTVDPATLF